MHSAKRDCVSTARVPLVTRETTLVNNNPIVLRTSDSDDHSDVRRDAMHDSGAATTHAASRSDLSKIVTAAVGRSSPPSAHCHAGGPKKLSDADLGTR